MPRFSRYRFKFRHMTGTAPFFSRMIFSLQSEHPEGTSFFAGPSDAGFVRKSSKKKALSFFFLGMIIFLLGPSLPSAAGEENAGDERAAREEALLRNGINSIRTDSALTPLLYEKTASEAADNHAEELLNLRSLSHSGSDGSRVNERYRRTGGTALLSGEILGAGDSVALILEGWMNSPSHRDSILNPDWTSMGVGLRHLNKNRILIVVIFTASRWRFGEMNMEGGSVMLSGFFLADPQSRPADVSLKIDGEIITSEVMKNSGNSASPNGTSEWLPVTFRFTPPLRFFNGSIVPAFVLPETRGRPSDLLLLRRP